MKIGPLILEVTMYDNQIIERSIAETINIQIDFTNWLSGASISTLTSVSSSGSDILSSLAISGTSIIFVVSGGTCGDITITTIIVTSDLETLVSKVKMRNR